MAGAGGGGGSCGGGGYYNPFLNENFHIKSGVGTHQAAMLVYVNVVVKPFSFY